MIAGVIMLNSESVGRVAAWRASRQFLCGYVAPLPTGATETAIRHSTVYPP